MMGQPAGTLEGEGDVARGVVSHVHAHAQRAGGEGDLSRYKRAMLVWGVLLLCAAGWAGIVFTSLERVSSIADEHVLLSPYAPLFQQQAAAGAAVRGVPPTEAADTLRRYDQVFQPCVFPLLAEGEYNAHDQVVACSRHDYSVDPVACPIGYLCPEEWVAQFGVVDMSTLLMCVNANTTCDVVVCEQYMADAPALQYSESSELLGVNMSLYSGNKWVFIALQVVVLALASVTGAVFFLGGYYPRTVRSFARSLHTASCTFFIVAMLLPVLYCAPQLLYTTTILVPNVSTQNTIYGGECLEGDGGLWTRKLYLWTLIASFPSIAIAGVLVLCAFITAGVALSKKRATANGPYTSLEMQPVAS